MGKHPKSDLPEVPKTAFMVVICRVLNGNDNHMFPKPLQALYTDVRFWKEHIHSIENNGGCKDPCSLPSVVKLMSMQDDLDNKYMPIYADRQMINVPISEHISYNCYSSTAFKLELGQNLRIFFVEMRIAQGKESAEHVIRPAKVITTSCIKARYAQQLLIIQRV